MDIVYSEAHKLQDGKAELIDGKLSPPVEKPARAEIILAELRRQNLGEVFAPREIVAADLGAVHGADYLDFLESAWDEWRAAGRDWDALPLNWIGRGMRQNRRPDSIDGKLGYYSFDAGSPITAGTWRAARAAAAVAADGARRLLDAKVDAAFALCRPPGHHAAADYYGGYCFLNNAAIAAHRLAASGARVAVWDVDYHHGNGTQSILYRRGDILFVSIHADPRFEFPFFSGFADEVGAGGGEGANLNLPLAAGCAWPDYATAMQTAAQAIARFGAEMLVVSFGADTYEKDPISHFRLTSDDFFRLGESLAAPRLPTLFVMEGGYAIDELGRNVAAALTGFAGA